ncbi:hypothetical protein OC844_007478, partial [Tilletia horrida]
MASAQPRTAGKLGLVAVVPFLLPSPTALPGPPAHGAANRQHQRHSQRERIAQRTRRSAISAGCGIPGPATRPASAAPRAPGVSAAADTNTTVRAAATSRPAARRTTSSSAASAAAAQAASASSRCIVKSQQPQDRSKAERTRLPARPRTLRTRQDHRRLEDRSGGVLSIDVRAQHRGGLNLSAVRRQTPTTPPIRASSSGASLASSASPSPGTSPSPSRTLAAQTPSPRRQVDGRSLPSAPLTPTAHDTCKRAPQDPVVHSLGIVYSSLLGISTPPPVTPSSAPPAVHLGRARLARQVLRVARTGGSSGFRRRRSGGQGRTGGSSAEPGHRRTAL